MNSHFQHRQNPNERYRSLDKINFESQFENQQYHNFNQLSFPYKLYLLLLQNETNDSIQWHADGLSFHISNSFKFTNELVDKYFKRTYLFTYSYSFHTSNNDVCTSFIL